MKSLYKKSKTCLLIIVTLTGIFWGCKKTENTEGPTTPVITVTASVAGGITDLNNIPISGASVSAGSAVTTTDAKGRFIIKNTQLDKDAGFVTITKPGFFSGSRTFLVNSNTVNNVKIQLIPKTVSGNFDAVSGGNINVSGGGSVNYGANNIVNESNNAAYTGSVSVSSFYLNPSDASFNQYMPGGLLGLNSNNQQNILQSFGMTLVEMNDANGGKLQIAKGKTATITIPIPSSMRADAPTTIPLWYFDETNGLWKQEGTATKQNGTYVGTVTHFSFWTAGQLSQSIELRATFTVDTGLVYSNKLVTISRSDSATTYGYTDSSGTVIGLVPANEVLTMKVFSDCGELKYLQNIGPFSNDTNLGTSNVVNDYCLSGDASQYINLSFNSKSYSWPSFQITERFQAGSYTVLIGDSTNGSGYFDGLIFGGNDSPGDYPISIFTIVKDNGISHFYQAGGQAFDPGYAYPITTITKYEAIGGYIEGTISGWIKTFPSTATADSFQLSGSYRVKRIQ
jgi:Uncharacterised protein family UPF0560.